MISASATALIAQSVAKAQDYGDPCFSTLAERPGVIEYGQCIPQPITVYRTSKNSSYKTYMTMAINAAMPDSGRDSRGCGESNFDRSMLNFERAKSFASTSWEVKEALRGHKAAWLAKNVSDHPQKFPALSPYSTWVVMSGIRSPCD